VTHGRITGSGVLLVLAGCAPALPAGDPTRPDLVLVSIDSLRADHLGAAGYERDTSPFLDRLAREGLHFTDARSASPWTLPSHTTMLTGRWPWEHGVVEDSLRIGEGTPLVTERLAAAGYRTAGFVSTAT
jgi:arylsulfatase A-like enzyme